MIYSYQYNRDTKDEYAQNTMPYRGPNKCYDLVTTLP